MNLSELLTPHKYGKPILAPSGDEGAFDRYGVDNARIFRHNGKIYLMYIGFDGKGYSTALAVSEDLIHWEKLGVILERDPENPLECGGRAVSCVLADVDLYGSRELVKVDGRYLLFYHAYPGEGYEVGAAANYLAWTTDETLREWHCEPEAVFRKGEEGQWDGGGLYSTWVFRHENRWRMYFNGKESLGGNWHEQTGLAESDDLRHWKRYAANPVFPVGEEGCWDSRFACGQHILWDSRQNRWVYFYCGFDGKHAQNGIGVSADGIRWEKYPEPILRHGEPGELDSTHAHKPCVLWHNGVLYHVYCAVRPTETEEERRKFGKEFRCLSIAASRPWKELTN